ncbi:hypothetical protein [Pseudonocardia spinosispora]|uniref:hypothetical protein n=1 Tax=Pseudonocardia spinosispora TaxID=103441 RepID=UPI0004226471|nr:hypothetical protein [Pseudonocardia spinosispora]
MNLIVYAVHAVRAEEISTTALVTSSLPPAERYAEVLSSDPGVLAAGVTRFELDVTGRRTAVALYVAGARQQAPYVSDDRRIYANGR